MYHISPQPNNPNQFNELRKLKVPHGWCDGVCSGKADRAFVVVLMGDSTQTAGRFGVLN
jgi:hypothetical protein